MPDSARSTNAASKMRRGQERIMRLGGQTRRILRKQQQEMAKNEGGPQGGYQILIMMTSFAG